MANFLFGLYQHFVCSLVEVAWAMNDISFTNFQFPKFSPVFTRNSTYRTQHSDAAHLDPRERDKVRN